MPNVNKQLTSDPEDMCEKAKEERKNSDYDLNDKRTSHAYQAFHNRVTKLTAAFETTPPTTKSLGTSCLFGQPSLRLFN